MDGCLFYMNVDSCKMICTKDDGGKFFYDCEQVFSYIADKCGKDVADMFSAESVEKVYNLFDAYSPCEYAEFIEEYKTDKRLGNFTPITELKRLRKMMSMFEELLKVYSDIRREYY